MKRILWLLFILSIGRMFSQELPLPFSYGVDKCYIKTHRVIPDYDLNRTYVTTKNFYEFDEENRIKEIKEFGGNNSYHGYYEYSYSDTLDTITYYSTHNVITLRTTIRHLNEYGDKEETLYSWGGKLIKRKISTSIPEKHQTKTEYYNDAGYPIYSEFVTKFPDGRIEKIITNDYDGFPISYDYFIYDDSKRLTSQRKVDYLDTLLTVVEYDYDENNNLIKKATIDFKTNKSIVNNYSYDILGRLSLEAVYEKSNEFGGIEELVMKREIYYDNYEEVKGDYQQGDEAREVLQAKLKKKAERDAKKLAKIKKKRDKENQKIEKAEKKKMMLLEERDMNKLEEIEKSNSETENNTKNVESTNKDGKS